MSHLPSVRSYFSMGRSISSPKSIAKIASELGYKSVILTDDATISGMTDLFSACEKLEGDLKAIAGVSIKVFDDPTYRPPSKKSGEQAKQNDFWEARLLVKNEEGLKALFRLLSLANSDEYFYFTPRIGLRDLVVSLKSNGLILCTGDFHSLFAHRSADKIYSTLAKLVDASNRYIELIPVKSAYFDAVNANALNSARLTHSKVIYSRPVLYSEGQADARDIMSYIIGNSSANHRLRSIPFNRDFHVMTPEQLAEEVKGMTERCGVDLPDSTEELVASCSYKWEEMSMCLPKMAEDEFKELTQLSAAGFKTRLAKEVYGFKPSADQLPIYKERLAYELKILRDMGFDRYFLLVRDVIAWSKSNGILVGPARGSAAGSLVAYLIGITDVDPIRFGLIFERFLNPDRLDYPDIDTDFMSSRRAEVIDYITERYGEENVAGISNYSMMGAASVIRDVGRIHDVPQDDLKCTKVIDQGMSLDSAIELPEIQRYAEAHPKLMAISQALDGSMRSLGRHAAGVVVAGEPLIERCVVERRGGERTVNWDKRTVESWGLIKLDILGLSTLDLMALVAEKLKKHRGITIDWESIPLNDKDVLREFGKGKTHGVFQFTGGGMRQLLKSFADGGRQLTFEDIYAATALFRPGPLQSGMADEYVQVKQGKRGAIYPHPSTEEALRETKGVIVYQEQVMKIARDLCGYTMAESDKLRKVMGKKLPEEMELQRGKFVDGARDISGMTEFEAGELFDKIAEFAGYGFNKSHAVAYSIISYLCMYAKVHYPAEFFAASLSIASEDELKPIVKDAATHGLVVVPPDINVSTSSFEIGYDAMREQHILHAPLDRVKMVSSKGCSAIIAAREAAGGAFTSKAQMMELVNRRACNARVIENLDKVGAFAKIEAGQIDPRHPDRLKDQKELIPGLMLTNVRAERRIVIDEFSEPKLIEIIAKAEAKGVDEFGDPNGVQVVVPDYSAKPLFMMVTDYAAHSELSGGKFSHGKSFNYTDAALKSAGLKKSNGYYTGLVKTAKKDKTAPLTASEINNWASILDEEIALLKPAIIIAAGSAASRYLCPDVKGGWEDLAGQVIYDVKRDCSIVLAPNPQMTFAKPEVQGKLNEIFADVAEMLN